MDTDEWQRRITIRFIEGKDNCVFATEDITTGEVIGYFEGIETVTNTMHSAHLEGKTINGTGILRNLAHSCDPNAYFKDKRRWLYALYAPEQ